MDSLSLSGTWEALPMGILKVGLALAWQACISNQQWAKQENLGKQTKYLKEYDIISFLKV